MFKSLVSLYNSPYNKKHPVFALYRLSLWKIIKALKLKNIKFRIWNNRKIFLNHDSFQSMWIMYNYIVDWEEFNLIRDYVDSKDNIADVGTNMGFYTIWMSKFISEGHIHSFEPDTINFKKLTDNIRINNIESMVKANNIALSDINGSLDFTVSFDGENHIATEENANTRKVHSRCFDDYCRETRINHLSYVKVDIEGFEYNFLKGSIELLENKKIDILQLEINSTLKNSSKSTEDLIELLTQYGYKLYKYNVEKKELITINYTTDRENYFAVSNIEAVNLRLTLNL